MTWYPTYPEKAPPEPEEQGSAWLELMEIYPHYLDEALGDNELKRMNLMWHLHSLAFAPLTDDDRADVIAEIRNIVEGVTREYAAAKEEAGEELP